MNWFIIWSSFRHWQDIPINISIIQTNKILNVNLAAILWPSIRLKWQADFYRMKEEMIVDGLPSLVQLLRNSELQSVTPWAPWSHLFLSGDFSWFQLSQFALHGLAPISPFKKKINKNERLVKLIWTKSKLYCFYYGFHLLNHHILYSHKGVICQFISQSGRNGGFSIAALLLQRRQKDLRVFISAQSVVNPQTGLVTSATYLCPCKLLLNDFIIWLHMTGKFQITDGVLMAAVDALKNTVGSSAQAQLQWITYIKNYII